MNRRRLALALLAGLVFAAAANAQQPRRLWVVYQGGNSTAADVWSESTSTTVYNSASNTPDLTFSAVTGRVTYSGAPTIAVRVTTACEITVGTLFISASRQTRLGLSLDGAIPANENQSFSGLSQDWFEKITLRASLIVAALTTGTTITTLSAWGFDSGTPITVWEACSLTVREL